MTEQCHAGGFKDAVLANSTAANTSFAAACTFDNSSMGGDDFDPFAQDWITGLAAHDPNGAAPSMPVPVPASAKDAFTYANAVCDLDDSPIYADKPDNEGATQYLTGLQSRMGV